MQTQHVTGGFDWIAAGLSWAIAYLSVAFYVLALWGYLTTSVPPQVVAEFSVVVALLLLFLVLVLRGLTRGRGAALRCLSPRFISEALVLPGLAFVPPSLYRVLFVLVLTWLGLSLVESGCRFLGGRLREYREDLDEARGGPAAVRTTRNDVPTGPVVVSRMD